MDTLDGQAGSHTFRLDFIKGCKASKKTEYFWTTILVTGEDYKAIFSIPSDTVIPAVYNEFIVYNV